MVKSEKKKYEPRKVKQCYEDVELEYCESFNQGKGCSLRPTCTQYQDAINGLKHLEKEQKHGSA